MLCFVFSSLFLFILSVKSFQTSSSSLPNQILLPSPNTLFPSSHDYFISKVEDSKDLASISELCVDSFSDEKILRNKKNNPFLRLQLNKLIQIQFNELSSRYNTMRILQSTSSSQDLSHTCAILKALGTNHSTPISEEIIGTVELIPHELDLPLLLDINPSFFSRLPLSSSSFNGKIKLPKIANLAVQRKHRKKGIGSALIQSCMQLAMEWGCNYIVLYVEVENISARSLYKSLGFTEMYIDRTEKRYRIANGGLTLRLETASKVLMMKCISE